MENSNPFISTVSVIVFNQSFVMDSTIIPDIPDVTIPIIIDIPHLIANVKILVDHPSIVLSNAIIIITPIISEIFSLIFIY